MVNEAFALVSFLIFMVLVLIATRMGKMYLFILSTSFILLSNITIQIPVRVVTLPITWAVIIYSPIYLITDILNEFYDRTQAYKLAACNLIVQLFLWGYVYLSLQVTPLPEGTAAYKTMNDLFASTARITFAAMIAALGPFVDIFIYQRIQERAMARGGWLSKLWLRNNLSTWVGQTSNTFVFFVVAFYGQFQQEGLLLSIIATALVVKLAMAVGNTPFIYLAHWFPPVDSKNVRLRPSIPVAAR